MRFSVSGACQDAQSNVVNIGDWNKNQTRVCQKQSMGFQMDCVSCARSAYT